MHVKSMLWILLAACAQKTCCDSLACSIRSSALHLSTGASSCVSNGQTRTQAKTTDMAAYPSRERRRRRRAQERETAAQLAIAAGCAHCLPEGSISSASQLTLPMGIAPNMMHLPMAISPGINPPANAISGMDVPMTSIFGPNMPALATLGLDALHLA